MLLNPLRILALPVDDGGCGNYRVRQPLKMIQKHTENDTVIADHDTNGLVRAGRLSDVCVIRQGGEQGIFEMSQHDDFKHLKYIIDIDDNVELISPYSRHYKEYGTQEYFSEKNNKWLWKDGVDGFNSEKNQKRLASFLNGLKSADLITVTTPILAEYARKYNKNVAVLPNYVDLKHWWPLKTVKDRPLRVGWSGGVSHYEDWKSIQKPLNDLMREYQFTLVMTGASFGGLFDEDNKKLVETHPWVDFAAHSYHMMALDLDIAVIPLADNEFNRHKSPIKLYEMCAMGVSSVCSDVEPYSSEIEDGINALPYKDARSFYSALESLIVSENMRVQLGSTGYEWVKSKDANTHADEWVNAYRSIMEV